MKIEGFEHVDLPDTGKSNTEILFSLGVHPEQIGSAVPNYHVPHHIKAAAWLEVANSIDEFKRQFWENQFQISYRK